MTNQNNESAGRIAARERDAQRRIPSEEELREMLRVIFQHHKTLAPTEKNLNLIGNWLEENQAEISVENISKAILVLAYNSGTGADPFDRQDPAPATPPPVAQAEPEENLLPGQLPLSADTWTLQDASPAQLRDFLKRAKAAGKK
jgi:hypothetical protein